MQDKILSIIFLDVYNNLSYFQNKKEKITIEDYHKLEKTLEEYLIDVLGYNIKYNCEKYYKEIKIYFENIIYNIRYESGKNLIENINNYKQEYLKKINDNKYVNLFIQTMNKLYSKSYKGRLSFEQSISLIQNSITISNKKDSLIIGKVSKKDEIDLPYIYINDIKKFNEVLKKYIESVFMSDSFYNLFSNKYFENVSFDDKVKSIFECTIFNATNMELNNVEEFFIRYTSFMNDKTFENIRKPKYIGNLFDDELYVMSKRSEIEYETPFYLAFMLKNKRVELPNVRMGIETINDKKIAHIIALQSAQTVLNKENLDLIQTEIKKQLPTDHNFRFYNPTHLISILLTFGYLNGLGIKLIKVKDFLPFRYYKTVLDKQMNTEEADNYQNRLTNKNLITYLRLIELVDGIDVYNYPELDMGLSIKLSDNIKCKNEFLQNIYDIGYKLGMQTKYKDEDKYII